MRKRLAACCLLVAALALDAGPACAQFRLSLPSDRPVRPWSRTEARPPSVSEMLLNPFLQWELRLTDEQIDRLEAVEAEVQRGHREEAERLARLREESSGAGMALFRQIQRETRKALPNILTPPQWERVRQIEAQLQGPSAFTDPAVQQELRLTYEQKEAIDKVLAEAEKAQRAGRRASRFGGGLDAPFGGPNGEEEAKRKLEQSGQVLKKLEEQLTPEQKKRWAALVGEPCKALPKVRPFWSPRLRWGLFDDRGLSADEIADKLQDELKLSEEQATRVRDLPEVIRKGHAAEARQLHDKQQEQQKEQTALEARQAAEMAKAMTAVLKPEQQRRLEQIRVQSLGLGAWDDPAVRKALKLTDKQMESIRRIREAAKANVRDMMMQVSRDAGDFGRDIRKQLRIRERKTAAAYRAVLDRMVAVLTPEQRKRWRELTGEPVRLRVDFEFQGFPGRLGP